MLTELREHRREEDESELLVKSRNGKPLTTTSLTHNIETIYRNAGINASGLHILRRTFASEAYRKGARVKSVAAYIGDEETTAATYYIAARQMMELETGEMTAVVPLPDEDVQKDE